MKHLSPLFLYIFLHPYLQEIIDSLNVWRARNFRLVVIDSVRSNQVFLNFLLASLFFPYVERGGG